MAANASTWLPPIIVTAGIGTIAALLRLALGNIVGKIDDLEASFIRITSDIVMQHRALEVRLDNQDRRITRLESWKELFSLPDMYGRSRRVTDRIDAERERDEDT